MTQQFQCLSCRGVYFDSSAEGGTYHHACPPLPPDATKKQVRDYNPRNENLPPAPAGKIPSIVSEGGGVKCLSKPALIEPAWITALKAKAAKAEEEE